jgi:branched-chain amino acid transport system substrate-binding protein
MKMKSLLRMATLGFIALFVFSACSPPPPPKDKIRIGRAVSLTGPNAIIPKSASIPVYDLWINEVNEKGGIYVKEYDKRLPIELIVYDDESDYEKMVLLLQKLIVEDKVDFVLPPSNTLYHFAAAPVANKLGYIMLGAEGGALKIEEYAAALPYFFPVLNFADTQMKALAEMYKENGVQSVAIIFRADLHGTEWSSTAIKEFEKRGITVKTARSIPLDVKDLSPYLRRAKDLDVDAFVAFTYPHESVLAVKQAIELGTNFKVFHVNVGPSFGWFPNAFGKAAEGIMGGGAWNCKSSPGAEEFCQKFIGRYGEKAADWWGHLMYYASVQFFEQAIEEAGTLNQEKIRDVMAKEKFQTVLGETWFEGGRLAPACHPGEIGQWQNGVFEVVARKDKATADPLIPKPNWPLPAPKKEQQASETN